MSEAVAGPWTADETGGVCRLDTRDATGDLRAGLVTATATGFTWTAWAADGDDYAADDAPTESAAMAAADAWAAANGWRLERTGQE